MPKNYITDQLQQHFAGRTSFSRKELYDFFLRFDSELKEATFRWRVYDLKAKKLIRPISRTAFVLSYKPTFTPFLENGEVKLALLVEKAFQSLKHVVWSTRVFNEFMVHQPGRFFTLIETEKEAAEAVFHVLQDNKVKNVYLQPEEKELHRYISELDDAVIVQPLVSKAPLQRVSGKQTITLEKMLVDVFAEKKLYYAYQGYELSLIFNNAYEKYSIDFTKLFSYAQRRKREKELKAFITQKTAIPNPFLYD